MSLEKSHNIPPLEDLENRFYNIDQNLKVKIDFHGYLREVDSYAPFNGYLSIKKIINILNRDINVIVSDEDLVKLRNSIIYFNEYFCTGEDNINGLKPAYVAYDRIESKYIKLVGDRKKNDEDINPFKNNVLKGLFDNDFISDSPEDVMDRYIMKKRRELSTIKSSKMKSKNSKKVEKTIPLHETFCKNMRRNVDFDNLEYCFEDVDYID